ncbi:hypothetical protein V4E86_28200 [Burkholderia pseudomallei]|nr:hypothetical protein [Burkholderia pseudomallei]MBF3719172.1 hypothetical protein [Burkholderia pseudomallei]MBF3781328.1 hypothetical protein [Burkholderia pseudomallei]MBF4062607.1 hypothetical protein [Burkholderia pseudomallei]MBF4080854.1 hypothetical protein [Burkholderia pseudomallei]
MALSLGNTLNTFRSAFNTVDSMASTASNIASKGASATQAGTDAASTEAQMQAVNSLMNKTALDAMNMQVQQMLVGAFTGIVKSAASNVKSAAQAG